jgi:hypothetical protein
METPPPTVDEITVADNFEDRKQLTFEQAEGVEPLPSQLKLKELSPQLRSVLWRVVHDSLLSSRQRPEYGYAFFGMPWSNILRDMHTFRYHRMDDDFVNRFDVLVAKIRQVFEGGDYVAVFGWLQWVLRRYDCPSSFSERIDVALRLGRAAYRILEGETIVPIGSDAELQTLQRAFADLAYSDRGLVDPQSLPRPINDRMASRSPQRNWVVVA